MPDLRLVFGAPRYLDRMLPLQLEELRPEGIELFFELLPSEHPAAATGCDLIEVPYETLLAQPAAERALVGLPVVPARDDAESEPLPARTVIALRRAVYEQNRWAVPALLDAFEAARESAYRRLGLRTSPALTMPWLVDQIEADEQRFGGDPFPVGAAANRPLIAGHEELFARESLEHLTVARATTVAPGAPAESAAGLRCRGLRYVDRTLPLEVGAPPLADGGLHYIGAPSLGGAFKSVVDGEFDVAEILLGDLVAELAERDDRLIGLPIFPARRFAQRFFWVARDSEKTALADLAGARIGHPPGGATAAVWASTLLEREGVEATFTAGPLGGKLAKMLDRGIEGTRLLDRLAAGELEALVTPYAIPAEDGGEQLRLLLPDPEAAERRQAASEGAMPIANVLAIGRPAYERDPEAVVDLLEAFACSRRAALGGLEAELPAVALPELHARIADCERTFGGDPYRFGVEPNRDLLAEFARHAAAIGAASREVSVAEMFPPTCPG